MRTLALLLTAIGAVVVTGTATAQTSADSTAIVTTSLNYIEGWFEGNSERMASALHGDLAKRIVFPGGDATADRLQHMTKEQLVRGTERGGGSRTAESDRGIDVEILDIFENASVVRVDANDWVAYLQIGKIDGEWKIINVLWAMRPEALDRSR